MHSDDHKTLAERRDARLRERTEFRRLRHGANAWPVSERKDRHRALVWLATAPTKLLMALHKAGLQHLEQQKEN